MNGDRVIYAWTVQVYLCAAHLRSNWWGRARHYKGQGSFFLCLQLASAIITFVLSQGLPSELYFCSLNDLKPLFGGMSFITTWTIKPAGFQRSHKEKIVSNYVESVHCSCIYLTTRCLRVSLNFYVLQKLYVSHISSGLRFSLK